MDLRWKVTPDVVETVRALSATRYQHQIGEVVGLCQATISKIQRANGMPRVSDLAAREAASLRMRANERSPQFLARKKAGKAKWLADRRFETARDYSSAST